VVGGGGSGRRRRKWREDMRSKFGGVVSLVNSIPFCGKIFLSHKSTQIYLYFKIATLNLEQKVRELEQLTVEAEQKLKELREAGGSAQGSISSQHVRTKMAIMLYFRCYLVDDKGVEGGTEIPTQTQTSGTVKPYTLLFI
jgi:hypothetical protein